MPEARSRRRAPRAAPWALALLILAAGRGAQGPAAPPPAASGPAPRAPGGGGARATVSVLYAGSLVDLMEHGLAPAFGRATGDRLEGFAGGSQAVANEIKGRLRRADVFISAAPSVDRTLMGQAGGDWVGWYAPFAAAPLVIGYNPRGAFAAALTSQPWYRVMAEKGFRLGRTDPRLDPKGALTVGFVDRAAAYYHQPGLAQALLGAPDNPAQVFPEQTLVGRLQAGQLDAGFFYANEAVQAGIPYLTPPAALDVGAEFTVTVLRGAPHPAAAVAFVRFLLGPQGQALMKRDGLSMLRPTARGDAAAVPAALRPVIG